MLNEHPLSFIIFLHQTYKCIGFDKFVPAPILPMANVPCSECLDNVGFPNKRKRAVDKQFPSYLLQYHPRNYLYILAHPVHLYTLPL